MQLELIQFVHRTANVTFTPLTRNTPHRRQNPKLAFIIHRWHKGIPHTKNCGVWNVKTFRRDLSLLSSRFTDHRGFEGDGNVFFFSKRRKTRTQWQSSTSQKTLILSNMLWEPQISINSQVFVGPEFKRPNCYINVPEDNMQCTFYTANK